MLRTHYILRSPAVPSVVLLYGIVFLFAIAYYAGMPWQRSYTIALYLAVTVWTVLIVFDRFQERPPLSNLIDYLFAAFLVAVMLSMAANWWSGTLRQLELMPVFFVVPYLLGRTMRAADGYAIRNLLLGMGAILVLLIFPEYVRVFKHGLPYEDSPAPLLFGQGHGVMLSGLLLAVSLLGLTSVLLATDDEYTPYILKTARGRYLGYGMLVILILTMGWISSRGSAITGMVGIAIVLLLAPRICRRRKSAIVAVLALAIALAVVHSLHRKHNAAYFGNLIQAPVLVDRDVDDTSQSPLLTDTPGSILGEAACKRIVDSVSDRWIHYEQAIALFLAKPLFGVGANHYGFYACTGPGSFPHSTLLQVFAELGAFVGLVYCTLVGATLHALMQSRSRAGPLAQPVWSWFVAFSVIQVLTAQLNGDYFFSAALYFVMGVAASAREDVLVTKDRC